MIDDIISQQGNIMTFNELKSAYPQAKVNFLTYYSLIRSIPQMWKERLSNETYNAMNDEEKNETFSFKIGNKLMKINDTRSSHFYQSWLSSNSPTAIINWESKGYQMNWEKIFRLPYTCTISTRLQTLHYRIVHRFIPTKKFLFTRRVVDSPNCPYCDETDNLEHFFFYCRTINNIWKQVFQATKIRVQNHLHACLFGIIGGKKAHNVIILIVKQYIVSMKLASHLTTIQAKTPTYEGAMFSLVSHVTKEKNIAARNNKWEQFVSKWGNILKNLHL